MALGICKDGEVRGQVRTFFVALAVSVAIFTDSHYGNTMNTELCKQALEKVGNPNVLVNIISRRVRQLNSGGGVGSRPLVADYVTMGAADIALTELVEDKMGYEMLSPIEEPKKAKRKKKKA